MNREETVNVNDEEKEGNMQQSESDRVGAGYARVSTAQQEDDGTSLETQEMGIRSLAAEINVPIVFMLREQGSGANRHRTKYVELQHLVRARVATDVFFHAGDRAARDPVDLLNFCRLCAEFGVEVHFVEGPSGHDDYAELIQFVTGFTGSQERKMIRERTIRGKIYVADTANRLPNGCGRGIYGYDYDKISKTRSINEEEALIVRRAFRDVIAGQSLYAIACELNEEGIPAKNGGPWHRLTLNRMLHNESYFGLDYYNRTRSWIGRDGRRITEDRPRAEWIEIRNFSPTIIDQEIYRRAQEQLGRPCATRAPKRYYMLTGLTFCGTCGTSITGASRMGKRRQYRCRATYKTSVDAISCDESYMYADELEEIVWTEVVEALKNPEVLIRDLIHHLNGDGANLGDLMTDLGHEISKLERKEKNLVAMASDLDSFDIDLVRSQSAPIVALLREKRRELEVLSAQQARADDVSAFEGRFLEHCQSICQTIDLIDTPEEKRKVLGAFDVKVWATKRSIKIVAQVDPQTVNLENTIVTTIEQTLALRRECSHRLRRA